MDSEDENQDFAKQGGEALDLGEDFDDDDEDEGEEDEDEQMQQQM